MRKHSSCIYKWTLSERVSCKYKPRNYSSVQSISFNVFRQRDNLIMLITLKKHNESLSFSLSSIAFFLHLSLLVLTSMWNVIDLHFTTKNHINWNSKWNWKPWHLMKLDRTHLILSLDKITSCILRSTHLT